MKNPDDWMILPEHDLARSRWASMPAQGDERWTDLVKWVHFALLTRRGTRRHQGERRRDEDHEQRPLSCAACSASKAISASCSGVDNDWAYRAIKVGGNYGEIYERYFGPKALGLPRGLNKLWSERRSAIRAAVPLSVAAIAASG